MAFMQLPNRKRNRLYEYDYSAPNAYFVTVCTDKRKNIFWQDAEAEMDCSMKITYTEYGKFVYNSICDISKHYPMITVDTFVIMPNHIHLLLQINTENDGRPMTAPTISTVVNMMKGAVTKQIGHAVWQKGFYDHVIRGEADYREIWNYIEGNPSRWAEDELRCP